MAQESFYDVLGLTDEERSLKGDAFNEACKKKYRALAVKYHPDKWASASEEERKAAEEKFKSVSEAYNTLTDEKKRMQYDYSQNGPSYDGFGMPDMEDLIRRATGGNPFGGFGNMGPSKGQDIRADVTMTIQEAYNGGDRDVTYRKPVKCHVCNGTGSADGKDTECPQCHGTGWLEQKKIMGPGRIFVNRSMCPNCHGTGRVVTDPCKACNGSGIEYETVTETIVIPPGMADGFVLTSPGMGGESEEGGPNGDLYIRIHVTKDQYFEVVENFNLVHHEEIPFNEAMLGFDREVKCIDGSTLTIHGDELTKDGKPFVFKGKGMPNPNMPGIHGDYAVIVKYKMPDKLTEGQKEMLRKFNEL